MIDPETILELFLPISQRADHVDVSGDVAVCRDKDDNLIIETAVKGEAEYHVTRDDDVKRDPRVVSFLGKYRVAVLSVSDFLKVLK